MPVWLGLSGLLVTLLAVLLSSWLAARAVARACLRAEHRELKTRLELLELARARDDQRDLDRSGDTERRLDRIERHLGFWSPVGPGRTT